MQKNLQENADDYGYLGGQSWLNASSGTSANEIMGTYYFRNAEAVHRFAHSPLHRDAWNWWNKNIAEMKHLGM